MTVTRGLSLRLATLLSGVALAATACGGGSSTPEAAAPPSTTSSASQGSDPSSPASSHSPAAHTSAGQVVKVTRYGVSYEVPKGWTSLDGTKALNPDSPILRSIAKRLNATPQQVIASFKKTLQSMAVTDHGAVNGILDNINAVAVSGGSLNDDQIKLQLATLGAKLGPIHHFPTPAGDGTRVAYRWTTNGLHFHGEIIAIETGDAVVSITTTAHSAAVAKALADQVEASIDTL